MVAGLRTVCRVPVLKERVASSPSSGSTPTTRHAGARCLAAMADPESRPPPPQGTRRTSSGPVSRGIGQHPAAALRLAEPRDRVVGAAELESPRPLQALALQEDRRPQPIVERARGEDRRPVRDAPQPIRGRLHGGVAEIALAHGEAALTGLARRGSRTPSTAIAMFR